MRPAKEVERLIRRARFKAGVNLHNRTITDALEAQVNSQETESQNSPRQCLLLQYSLAYTSLVAPVRPLHTPQGW